jgi:hypothetical protein
MIATVNVISAVGLVTLPGVMTGQFLGDTSPVLASRYPIVVLFLIAASVGLASVAAVLALLWSLFDDAHRLRSERSQRRSERWGKRQEVSPPMSATEGCRHNVRRDRHREPLGNPRPRSLKFRGQTTPHNPVRA